MIIKKKTNFRVIVEPKTHVYGISLSYLESDCNEMVEQIKRHIDNVQRAYVEFDTEETCSHCGYGWEIDNETGEPACCDKAIEEFNNEKVKQP